MNRFFLSLCVAYACSPISAQSLCKQIIGSTGQQFTTNQGVELSFSIGQAVIPTLVSPSVQLTQGFHQPEICSATSSTHPVAQIDFNALVYPNPAARIFHFQLAKPQQERLYLHIMDMNGRVMQLHILPHGQTDVTIDAFELPSGMYRLICSDRDQNVLAQLPFVLI